jgi:hypothetical protein
METTTTETIRGAIIDAIRGITPTHLYLREAAPWAYALPDQFTAGAQPRVYTLAQDVARPVWGQFSNGELYMFKLEVIVAYVAIPTHVLADVLSLDAVDLRKAIDDLRDPTVPGLAEVIFDGADTGRLDSDGLECAFKFTIHYLQNTGLH